MNPIRVLVVENHLLFRSCLIHWLNQQPNLTCCGEAGSVAAARRVIENAKPDVILLDLHLSEGDALDFVRELAETHPGLRLIALVRDEPMHARGALPAGIAACVVKSEATETVLSVITAVAGGQVACNPSNPAPLPV